MSTYAGLARAVQPIGRSSSPNRAAQLTYWLNAYNAFVVRGVIDNYPTRSVLHLYGFFRRKDYIAGGQD